jgi:hypothetical protein
MEAKYFEVCLSKSVSNLKDLPVLRMIVIYSPCEICEGMGLLWVRNAQSLMDRELLTEKDVWRR